jgi:hypothetical protein
MGIEIRSALDERGAAEQQEKVFVVPDLLDVDP